ncbi:hypothetical protein [Deinococcus sp. QL22]|uniref:hypothetical protein n=1 Tax=Deinococcus sp. QL22 TaxID=2939437 RepID=UPI002016CD63|nr:hypothetical protein [Deinococcus sp. QL22]UQN08138.1 hypothetical protein M1R55_18820 [Deinococcus sp. QL22]
MAYLKLSEQVQKLSNLQRSDAFVKQFQIAVREGKIEAVKLPGARFELPKQFKRRSGDGETYNKLARDMLFEVTPEFQAWFEKIDAQLREGRASAPRVSLESIESGAVDFKALAAHTRQQMEASFLKGQKLGSANRKAKARSRKK